MTDRESDVERWLANEQQGEDNAAEAAFAQLFASLPRVEPGPAFVQQTVLAVWKSRARRRRFVIAAQIAASIAIGIGCVGVAYAAMAFGGAAVITTGVAMASRAMVGPIVFMANSIQWWSTIARAASTVGDAIATPLNQVILISTELWCVFAVYALHRLLRMGLAEPVNSWERQ
jgi:hypothetical protein